MTSLWKSCPLVGSPSFALTIPARTRQASRVSKPYSRSRKSTESSGQYSSALSASGKLYVQSDYIPN